ncbi:hypothetical protein JTB14_008066 [Gonioctena quinquepunctata]|nr:hypothetical protein JTB14_008066 [Gonioctena quinquepunctata]
MVAESILVQPEENMIEQPISDDQSKDFLAILHKTTIIYSPVSHEQLETPMVVPPEGNGVDLIKSHDREIPLVIVSPEDVVDLPIHEDQLIILEEIPYDPYNVDYIEEVPTPVERRPNTIMHSTPMEIVRDSTSQDDDLESEAVHNSHKDIYHRSDGIIDDAAISKNNALPIFQSEDEREVEDTKRINYKDRRDSCFFCEKDISHFARHMFTWHGGELEIQRILAYKNNSKERRNALSALRKKGNFVRNRTSIQLRPVKRVQSLSHPPADDYLPCPYCLGFYKKKSLYRHTKCCPENISARSKRQNAQSQGQTTLLLGSLIKHDELLKKDLFPLMRADKISLIAKKDTLICNYGYSYLKGRRSVNEIACYNSETDIYESPTVAVNFGTLIKKCCDLAYIHLLQIPNTNDERKELKILKTLVASQWANEVSAQAEVT